MMLSCVMISEGMVVLGLQPLELMQCLRTPSEMLQGGVQELVILYFAPAVKHVGYREV